MKLGDQVTRTGSIARIWAEERALVRSTISSFVVRIVGMIASFAGGVLLARALNPDGFGSYGIVVALALVLSVGAQLGLPTLATREISVALSQSRVDLLRLYVRWCTRIVLLLSVVASSAWLLVVVVFPGWLGSDQANVLGALLVPLFALTVLASAELRALGRVVLGQSFEILIRPALTCTLLVVVFIWFGRLTAPVAVGINVAASAATLLAALLSVASALPKPRMPVFGTIARGWLAPALPLAGVDLLRQLDATYGMLLLGGVSTEAEAGYFRVALSTIIMIATPLSIFNVVLAPLLAQAHGRGDKNRLQRILTISATTMFFIALVAFLAVALFGRAVIMLVFGTNYEAAWAPLLLLTGAQVINGFFGVGPIYLSMSGGEKRLAIALIFSVGFSIAVALPMAAMSGALGVAAAAVVGALVQNIIARRAVRTHGELECSVVSLFHAP